MTAARVRFRPPAFVIGVGSAGPHAAVHVEQAFAALEAHPALRLASQSDLYASAPAGGATALRFVNTAVVVETTLAPRALMMALRRLESASGRVRARRNAARALDLDILLGVGLLGAATDPCIPHPRIFYRPFALSPAVEALRRAGLAVPVPLERAARSAAVGGGLHPLVAPCGALPL